MGFDKKKVFSRDGFPNHTATDEVKNTPEYGLQMAKAIEYEWFYRPETGNSSCTYYDKRDKYHNLRLYGRGEQSTKRYKERLGIGENDSFGNYDFRPLQIIPKFVKLIVNQMTERLFDIKAEATDKFSTDLKDNYKRSLEDLILSRPTMNEAKNLLGVDLAPQGSEEFPETKEEIDLFMQLKYKPAIEIATEEAIKFTLELNDFDEIKSKVIEDITVIGLGAIKHVTDPNKGIMVKYVDPANMVYSYPVHRNFKDVHYYGEVKRITIHELRRLSGDTLDEDELKEIAKGVSEWGNYHGINTNENYYRESDLSGLMVDVLFFNFKSTNTLSYKKKFTKNGGFKMTKKSSDFKKTDSTYKGYDVSKKIIDVWYEGVLILGTNKLFNYKLCENMIRPKGHLNITTPNYIIYAPELYQNRARTTVERIIPYVDQMQEIHIKIQQMIANARPNGIVIDIGGMNEINMGDGNAFTPLDQIKLYNETGNYVTNSVTQQGEYNNGKHTITELNNGVIQGLDRLVSAYNHYLTLVRDAIGIPLGADASTPHPDMAVGVQNNLAANSNTATRHILEGGLNISERLGKCLALRIKDIFEYSDLKNTYINAIGKINVKILEALKRYALHDLGINIELKPDTQEKQYLEMNINQALAKDIISLDDAIDIRNISNIKLANELLKVRRVKREKDRRSQEQQMEELRAQTQERAVQASAQAASQQTQAELQKELMIIEAKSKAKMLELDKEVEAKSVLMRQEFDYNMSLKGQDVQINSEKENRKDKRQDRNNSQASELIQQRNYNEPAKSFESSEDSITGGIDLSDMNPT